MNDIKNENERLTLPFVPEAVIVGNGDFPSHPFPLAVWYVATGQRMRWPTADVYPT
jgi:hypothetical protein